MYQISYDPEAWERVGLSLEWRQVVERPLDSGLHLVVTLARGFGGVPLVVAAWVEHRYRTRYAWKRRTIRRVSPKDVTIAELSTA